MTNEQIQVQGNIAPTSAQLNIFDRQPINNSFPISLPLFSTANFTQDPTIASVGGYTFYSTTININSQGATVDFDFVVNGKELKLDFIAPVEVLVNHI